MPNLSPPPRRRTASLAPLLSSLVLVLAACGEPLPVDPGESAAALDAVGAASNRCAPTPAASSSTTSAVYYRYASNKTWNAAKTECEAMGGRLAIPFDSTSNSTLAALGGTQLAFLGIKQSSGQSSTTAHWYTLEGTPPAFTSWGSGEPNDGNGSENGAQNCSAIYPDGSWDDISCTGTSRNYVCEFGAMPLACGGGSTCGIASGESSYHCQCPTGTHYDAPHNACFGGALAIVVNSLDVGAAASGNVFVNFPVRGHIGIKGTGNTNNVVVSLGLMERLPSGAAASDTELASLKSCLIGAKTITLPGDNTQQYVDIDGLVAPECLGSNATRDANFFVLLDAAEETSDEEDKWLVFNAKEASTPIGLRCTTTDPVTGLSRTGCVIDVTVRQPPGLDIALLGATPDSSVAVLAPTAPPPHLRTGSPGEAPRPLVTVNAEVVAFGRDFDTPDAGTLPSDVGFTYDLQASPDPTNVGWKPLNLNPDATHASLDDLEPGETLQVEARLHPTPELRNLLAPGGAWAATTTFNVRGCAHVTFPEAGDPVVAGTNGQANNCKTFAIHIVPGDQGSTSATSEDVSKTYSGSWGSSSTLKLALSGGSTNVFGLTSGAATDNDAKATMSGFFGSFDLFEAWGDADAKISGASIDTGLKTFGVSLFSYSKSLSTTITFPKDISYSKEKCLTYSYGIVVVSVDLEGCFSAGAGLDTSLTVSPTSLTAQVRPHLEAELSVSATLNLTIYRASLTGSLTLLGLNSDDSDGITGSLWFSVGTSPTKLTLGYDIVAMFSITTMDGSLDLEVEQLELNWCKRKKWGITFKYPCWDYDTIADVNLFSYDGFSFDKSLLDRSASSVVLQ